MPEKKIKIAMTMGSLGRIWSNGLDQNIVFLAHLLQSAGFEPMLFVPDNEYSKNVNEYLGIKVAKFEGNYVKSLEKFDVVMFLSVFLDPPYVDALRKKGVKTIMIDYGNYFQIFNEAVAKNIEVQPFDFSRYALADAVWVSPHFERNISWYTSFTDTDVEVCPYVWDSMFFDSKCKEFKGEAMWSPEKNVKNIAIHEPNINFIKTCTIPLAIAGKLNKQNPELVDNVFVLNSQGFKDSANFIDYVKSLDLVKKGSFDSRRSTPFMACSATTGLSLFHHTFNGLNYLPMEMMRLGYPVVHNSDFFKDAGYYYPEIDVDKGVEQLKIAIETHEDKYEEQLEASKELLYRYSIENPGNIKGYKELIEKLLDS
jgi:hypothetical protein